MSKVAIVGMGYVGKGMAKIFPDAAQYDEPLGVGTKEEVNECELAIVCVPTPSRDDGSCDTSIVEEVVQWLTTDLILLKSTVSPSTTERLMVLYKKRICFSPEYMGEGKYFTPSWRYPDPENPISHGFMVIGGAQQDCSDIVDIFMPKMGPHTRVRIMPALEAELVKYFENTWGATKVTLANEFRKICETFGANWHLVREGWIDDPRVEPMHTAVFKEKRGFSGKCFPKDTSALLHASREAGYEPTLIAAMIASNDVFNRRRKE